MNNVQDRIFEETAKLLKKTNYLFVAINGGLTAGLIFVIMALIKFPFDVFNVTFVILMTGIYIAVRRIWNIRYGRKIIAQLYELTKEKRPQLTIYIPMLENNFQGFFLRSAALYVYEDELYLEAFSRQVRKKVKRESISVRAGKEFYVLDSHKLEKKNAVTYKAMLMDTDYQFTVPDMREIIDTIENYNKKEV